MLLLVLSACTQPCAEGYGRGSDGNCYALAGTETGAESGTETGTDTGADNGAETGDSDTDTDSDTDADSDTDTDVDTGVGTARLSGVLTYRGQGALNRNTVCFIALWDESDLTGGFPDPAKGTAMGQTTVTCPTEANNGVDYEADVVVTGAATVGAFAGMDLDGDSATTDDLAAGGYFENPFGVKPDGVYPGINIDTF